MKHTQLLPRILGGRARRELVHEKAYFDGGLIKTAQDEADKDHAILVDIDKHFFSE
jgi:hypothetical protein